MRRIEARVDGVLADGHYVGRPQRAGGSAKAAVGERRLAQRAHGKAHPQVVENLVLLRRQLADHHLLRAAGVEVNVEDTVLLAHHAHVQQVIGQRRILARQRAGRPAGERDAQPQRIHLGQRDRLVVIGGNERGGILRRAQVRLQLLDGVVVEAQIRRGNFLFQHAGADEAAQRSALAAVRRTHQHFAFALEVSAGDVAVHRLGEGDGAVVEPDMQVFAVEFGFANLEDVLGIEADGAQRAIERQHRRRSQRIGRSGLRRGGRRLRDGGQRAERNCQQCENSELRFKAVVTKFLMK